MEFILKNKKLFALAFWVWVSIILYFSLTPNGPKLKIDLNDKTYRLDYIFHFVVYFGLAIIYTLWKADKYFNVKSALLIYFLIIGIALSGIIEYSQSFIPGRTFNPIDFYANTAGIIIGILIPKLLLKQTI